ncbi:hypothetical protein TNCT_613821 [Trichonephila clavata]|uniref:Uncharacterized protein n=1 Tax=Trichonephila clavata TaxID=2740835 RepID=A0A8X6H9V8_TRICU|nr:hypothetical protein TNCT_613821 [Trichonephila clavata]
MYDTTSKLHTGMNLIDLKRYCIVYKLYKIFIFSVITKYINIYIKEFIASKEIKFILLLKFYCRPGKI